MGRTAGWILSPAERQRLLKAFAPAYDDIIADHVTFKDEQGASFIPDPAKLLIVGRADDGRGIEALVVSVDGSHARPDGSIYHCTWSRDPKIMLPPVHSNRLIAEAGFEPVAATSFTAMPGWLR